MKAKWRNFLFLALANLDVCDGKVGDGKQLAQELKELAKQPAREGSAFGSYLSEAEKAAFRRQRDRELKALKSGCTNDHCAALQEDALGSGDVRRSLQETLPGAQTNNETLSDCLSRSCPSDYEICADDSDCASYLSECLESDDSASDSCQEHRSRAWVEVKFLVYCYDSQCGGDGTQSEREKTEEELLRDWDEDNVCQDHPYNWYSCEENVHCLHQDEGEDGWCSHEDARVMCRDCAGPGEKCESSRICSDELLVCDQLTEDEKAALDPLHPCVHESCAVSRRSSECADVVFDHCCDPESEGCDREERSTCSSAGCSRFTDPNWGHEIDYEKATCPFGDVNGTCLHPSCDDPDMFREIVDMVVGNENYCHGPWCFPQMMVEACEIATLPDGGTNGTSTAENGRRKLGQLESFLVKQKKSLSPFQSNFAAQLQQVFQSGRRRRQLLTRNPRSVQQQRDRANRELENAEGLFNRTEIECLLAVCPEDFNACQENEDCAYAMYNCTDDSNSDQDCEHRWTNISMPLFGKVSDCYAQHCYAGEYVDSPVDECMSESCPVALESCIGDEDCTYVIENCAELYFMHHPTEHHGRTLQKSSDMTSHIINVTIPNITSPIVKSATRIPKTIIQTSKSNTIDRLDWLEYRRSLMAVNPTFELVHYDDAAARSFIGEHYGDSILERAYDAVTPIMRADLFRLAAVYKLGGFYMDMDMLGKASFDPIVEAIEDGEYGAVFPKEWWVSSDFYSNIFPGKVPRDAEDHWQMGQYAFAAVPEHPFIKDALEEAIVRSVKLMRRKGDDIHSIEDVDILAATGPYLFTELYHKGRKEGLYSDVLHLPGDSAKPVLENRSGGRDWHKFGGYAEHMLSHTWTKPERRKLEMEECESRMNVLNNDTRTVIDSIGQCYEEKCSHLDVHGPEDEFQHILNQAWQCLENDDDGCAWAKEACDEDEACSGPLEELFQCELEECVSPILEQGIQNRAFAEVVNCVERNCGISGDDSDDHQPPSINSREECAAVLSSYCSDHPEEKACQSPCPYGCKAGELCPCANESCLAEYAAPMCARSAGPCHEYKEGLRQLYLDAGYYQPRDEWNRNRLAHFLMDPPPEDLDILANLPAELEALGEACNAVHQDLADHISACLAPSIDFCNVNEWDQGCRTELSTCGDGIVSWHESCDDGNRMDWDGCSSWCYPDTGYICPEQDEPCQTCLRDERAEWGDERVCKFCSENARVNMTSPCFASECQGIEDYEGAKACDDHVERFCAATLAAGKRDLGCDTYTRKDRMYTVPTVPNKCEYKIKSFLLNSKSINKVKLAVFTCKFEDPHGTLEDTTPVFKYRHPYDSLSTDEQKALPPQAKVILDAMLETRQEKLISLNDLRLDDFFPYVHPALATEEGHPIHFHESLARLVIHHEEPEPQERYDSYGNLNCHREGEHRDLFPLPATPEPLKMGLKAYLMKQKWEAMNNPYGEEEDEFKHFDVNAIDGGESAPRLNSTAIFGIKLSTTWKSHGHGGRVEEWENKEWVCKDWSQVDWSDIENDPDCTSFEDSIRNGNARIFFEQNLFQAGCEDDECDLRVDHCREVGVTPQRLEVDAEGFSQTAEQVMSEVEKMTEAESWPHLVEKFIRVSAAASTQAYDDAMDLFNRLVLRGKKTKFMRDIPDYCEHDYFADDHSGNRNPEWESDPCCNWELRQYQCCAPKDVPNGEIDIVLGVNRAQVSTYCEGYSSEVENLLQDVMVNIDQASSCAEQLESSVSANVWDETWKVKDVCYRKIYDAESMECEKDEDCSHCSQSTCRLGAGSTTGTCQVPWDDTEGCMLECLSKEMDPELVRYLREEWQVPATATDEVFREAFVERMTEPACSGPRAWEEDIGRNGYEWQCNTTCTAEYLCDDYDYMEHLQQVARDEGSSEWINFWDSSVCESHGGSLGDWGQCEFDSLASAPCKQESECYEECQKPHTQDGCAELNGTWIQNPGNWYGRCCPPDTHVFYDPMRGEKICSYVPEGSPNGWELRSPSCCEAEQGSWKVIDGHGQCCLGRWMSYTYEGQTHTYCSTEVWGWDNSECYESCDALRQECQTCRVEKMECCGEVYKSANRTACESYMECTDSSIWEGSGQTCDDPAPFCAHCHGKHCYKAGEPSACFVNVDQQECEGGVEGMMTEWNADRYRCQLVTDSANASGWDCFTPGPAVCPDPTDYPWSYNHNNGLVPKTQWGEQTCNRGCYVPTLTDQETCEDSSNYETGIYYYWDTSGGNGNGVCSVHNVADEEECNAILGVFVPYSLTYSSGRFSTEDECHEGECMGNLGYGGWSREQCESSENYSCTRSCQQCVTWHWEFYSQGGGGCFSSNMTTCASEGASQVPCVVSGISESDCIASNELQVEWKSCSSYVTNEECTGEDGMDPHAQLLGCSWQWSQCETQEACEAVGECNDWDNRRQVCQDSGWEHGDTCWASYLVEITNEETQQVTSSYEYASCNECRDYDGVCVEPRPDEGCGDNMWHRLGCKVFGLHDEASCKLANATNEWYTRAKTKEECLAIKACKEPGRHHLSELPPEECTLCGGELEPMFEWHGGAWVKPKVQNMTWVEGTFMAPVNEWKPAIADYLLEKELALPIIKRFANRKQTQALLMFNVFTEALQTLACACGSGNRTNCFDSTEGSVAGVSKAFCGLETPINAACGTAVVKKTCLTEEERRLRRLSQADNIDSMDITWMHYSAGTYGNCFEPYSSSDDRVLQNPLAVKNSNGVVIGQLLGDGKGFVSTGDFESVELCLDRRSDIREWDAFDVLDVGRRSDDGMSIVPQYNTEWVVNDGLKMCFIATSDGVYFPIYRADSSGVDLNTLNTRLGACDNTKGISLFNATSNMLVCVCRCGYSGDACDAGCPNDCSGHGECLDNGQCSCSATRAGVDCGEFNCPIGLQGKRCSGQGLCKEDATCECEDNFMGYDCADTKVLPQEIAIPPSFDDFQATTTNPPSSMPSKMPSVPTSSAPSLSRSSAPSPSTIELDKSKFMYFWGILDRKVKDVQTKYEKFVTLGNN